MNCSGDFAMLPSRTTCIRRRSTSGPLSHDVAVALSGLLSDGRCRKCNLGRRRRHLATPSSLPLFPSLPLSHSLSPSLSLAVCTWPPGPGISLLQPRLPLTAEGAVPVSLSIMNPHSTPRSLQFQSLTEGPTQPWDPGAAALKFVVTTCWLSRLLSAWFSGFLSEQAAGPTAGLGCWDPGRLLPVVLLAAARCRQPA